MSIAVYGCAALPSAAASAGRAASWARQPSAPGHPNKKAGELVANRGNRLKVDGYLRQRTVQFAKRVTELSGAGAGAA